MAWQTRIIGILFLLCLQSVSFELKAQQWQILAPGIEYQDLGKNALTHWSHIHAFRIDLQKNKLDLITANQDLARQHASAEEFANHSKALITINGGFFDPNYQPLGLRIRQQQQYNPAKAISWWGIFYTKEQKPYITSFRNYRSDKAIDFAVQAGPRLLIDGNIPSLKPGYAERSALGITSDGKIIILITENTPMSTTTLAQLLKAPPLRCDNALNLDGGSSSQLNANIGSFKIRVYGFSHVSDAIVVKPR